MNADDDHLFCCSQGFVEPGAFHRCCEMKVVLHLWQVRQTPICSHTYSQFVPMCLDRRRKLRTRRRKLVESVEQLFWNEIFVSYSLSTIFCCCSFILFFIFAPSADLCASHVSSEGLYMASGCPDSTQSISPSNYWGSSFVSNTAIFRTDRSTCCCVLFQALLCFYLLPSSFLPLHIF